jgi:hypothetical protein
MAHKKFETGFYEVIKLENAGIAGGGKANGY